MAIYRKTEHYDEAAVAEMAGAYRTLLGVVGEDLGREGLAKTPERAAKALALLTSGMGTNPDDLLATALFESPGDEMVLVRNIEVYSLCEHHLLPFFGKAHVAYIPSGKIVGLSKIPRMVDAWARRPQVQERLTCAIRDSLDRVLAPQGVAVVIEAHHLCMQMRGVEKQNATTTTSAFTGGFLTDSRTRKEFMHLVTR
jgi:GTP cyclohydrolase I